MDNCRICGKKFGFFAGDTNLIGARTEVKVCGKCSDNIELLDFDSKNGNVERYNENLVYFESFIKAGEMDVVAVEELEYVIDKIKNANKYEIENQEKKIREEKMRNENLKNFSAKKDDFKVTTGYEFQGYQVLEYIKVVSSECVMGTGFLSEVSAQFADFLGTNSVTMENKLSEAKEIVQDKLIVKAIEFGANALIGVDFDMMSLGNNVLVVSVNGTAVKVEKI